MLNTSRSFSGIDKEPALLLTQARVIQHPGSPANDSVLLRGGRVIALGAEALARAAETRARSIRLDGATIMPGLIDTHPHLLHFAAEAEGVVQLNDAQDHPDILRRVAAAALAARPGSWVFTSPVGEPFYGRSASYRSLPERQLPDRYALDTVAPDVPVMIQAYAPAHPGVVVFNSAALASLDITEELPSDLGTVFAERGWNGDLTGRFYGEVQELYVGNPFWASVLERLPRASPDLASTTRRAVESAHRRGVTAIYEPHETSLEEVQIYRSLVDGGTRLRVSASPEFMHVELTDFESTFHEFGSQLRKAAQRNDDWIRVLGPSFSLHSDFAVPPRPTVSGGYAQGDPGTLAVRLRHFVAETAAAGLRGSVLSASTAQHDLLLETLAHTPGFRSPPSAPWIVQHFPVITPAQIAEFARLGIAGTTSPGFARGLPESMLKLDGSLGPQQEDLVPIGRFSAMGFPVAAGSDWGPRSPFAQIGLALAHAEEQSRHGSPAFSRAAALAMWTTLGSQVLAWPEVGSLAPGAYADAVILPEDPMSVSIEQLGRLEPLATLVDGEAMFDPHGLFA